MDGLVQIRRRPGASETTPTDKVNRGGARVYVETFGCQMNEADSALIVGQLQRSGYQPVPRPDDADVILINTCAVREKAEERVYGRTSQLLAHRRHNPDLVIGVTGCMAEHLRDKLTTRAPHVQLVAGPDSYRRIGELVDRARAGERAIDVSLDKTETYTGLDGVSQDDGVSAFVTIQRGCDKFCTFCVVPYTRGRERGVAPREVLRQVRQSAAAGYREVVLLGQTVNSYRYEGVSFADLLRATAEIDGIERIRFTSPYPIDFSDAVIEALAHEPKLCPYVHLPVQSGSDRMLTAMKRGYSRGEFMRLVTKLRHAVPDIALSTDVMVGFCGETEADHAETLSLLQEVQFDSAFMFAYSDREITYASRKLVDDVPPEIKQRRLREVIERQEHYTRQSHDRRVGQIETVLINGPSKRNDCLVGRTGRFQNVLLPLDAGASGDLVARRITRSSGHSLDTR
ncbi:MAG: tRNA (N6-isopentenyl adenosine(37)-C2)-methylthiotransferase MiaB [Myxococcales bacterium FL481]|nr:MAG: tRNA (N6-isopentenyl adenosine(37)-C2)-methylthiotransferase MiaB [Myxococcales bacterium FL481]